MSFLLDTNVVSELRRPEKADPAVLAWAEAQDASIFHLSAITVLEIEHGIALLERRDRVQGERLRRWAEDLLREFEGRILPVDAAVAIRCARLHVPDPRPDRDGLIAATAIVHDMTLVSRNTRDFEGTGVRLLDPWAHRP